MSHPTRGAVQDEVQEHADELEGHRPALDWIYKARSG